MLIYGPRQCGKTTLAQQVGTRLGYTYITFDEDVARAAAEADPVGFVADLPDHAILGAGMNSTFTESIVKDAALPGGKRWGYRSARP